MQADDSSRIPADDAIETVAAEWLARRDRGFSGAEQDIYLQWLGADPRHAAAVRQLEQAWGSLDVLAEWRPADSAEPNPDLLARPADRAQRRSLAFPPKAAAGLTAAAIALGFFLVVPATPPPPPTVVRTEAPTVRVFPAPETLTLPDGTTVLVNHGGRIEAAYTVGERRVRLAQGEAHFTVVADAARPFLVETDGVVVRAVGTVFNVQRGSGAVEVIVTEGAVEVRRQALAGVVAPVRAGEHAIVDTTQPAAAPVVAALPVAAVERALAWRSARLEFAELPLANVVAEFNLRNGGRLAVADEATGRVRVGGNFRADNVESFVRLLEASFGVRAERRPDGATLLRLIEEK